jgi:cyanate lyase
MKKETSLAEQRSELEKSEKALEKFEKRLLQLEEKTIERLRIQTNVAEEVLKITEAKLALDEQAAPLLEKQMDLTGEIFRIESELKALGYTADEIANSVQLLAIKKDLADIDEKIGGYATAGLFILQQTIDESRDLLELKQKVLNIEREIDTQTENVLATTLGVSRAWESSFSGILLKAKDIGVLGDSLKRMMHGAAGSLAENFGPSMMMKVQEQTIAMAGATEDARANFVKATGAGSEQVQMILEQGRQFRFLGIGIAETGAATAALYQDMVSFNRASDAQQLQLVKNVAILEKFGVSLGTAAKIAGEADVLFGMNAESVAQLNRELFAISGPGLSTSQIFQNFATILPRVAKHGNDAISVFKGLSAQTRVLKIDTQELLGIAEGYDTFAGAADKVATLNAALGGDYFNSMEMLNSSEERRIELMLEGMQASGKSWESMNKFEKMLVASGAGISDMSTAQKIFNKDLGQYRTELAKVQANSMSPEQLDKQAKATQTLNDNLKAMASTFAISFSPLINMFNELLQVYGRMDEVVQKISHGYFGLGTIVAGVFMAFRLIKGVVAGMTLAMQFNTSATVANTAAVKFSEAAAKSSMATASANVKNLVAVGAAVGMIGLGLGAAAAGFASLAKSMENLNGEQINGFLISMGILIGGIGIVAAGLIVLAVATGAAAVPILAVGGAVTLMGAGFALAAWGASLLVDSLKGLESGVLGEITVLLGAMSGGMLTMSTFATSGRRGIIDN